MITEPGSQESEFSEEDYRVKFYAELAEGLENLYQAAIANPPMRDGQIRKAIFDAFAAFNPDWITLEVIQSEIGNAFTAVEISNALVTMLGAGEIGCYTETLYNAFGCCLHPPAQITNYGLKDKSFAL